MKRNLLLLILQAIIAMSIAQSPVGWQQSYGGSSTDKGTSMYPTQDSGFITLGHVKSIDGDVTDKHGIDTLTTDIWVVKTSSSGDIEWTRSYGGSNNDYGKTIQQTPDKGYLIATITYSNDGDILNTGFHGNGDIFLIKTDSLGDIIWSRCYGGSGHEGVNNVIQTTDGGYLVLGQTYASGSSGDLAGIGSRGWTDWFVLKLDGSGNIQWKRGYGGNLDDHAQDALMTSDGGYIIVGEAESYAGSGEVTVNIGNNHTYDVWVLKVNSVGAIQWRSNFGGTQHEWGMDIKPTSDGNYLIAGWTMSTNFDATGNHGGLDGFLVKMNPSGGKIWSKVVGGTGDEKFARLLPVKTTNFLIAGFTRSNDGDVSGNHGSHDGWMVEVDTDGNIQWQACVGSSVADELGDLNHLLNESVVMAGYAGAANGDVAANNGRADVWVFVLEATDATLSNLTVDGTTIDGFSPDIFTYDVVLPFGTTIIPSVTATTSATGASHVITNPGALPGSAIVNVTSTDGSATITYTINYIMEPSAPVSSDQSSCYGLPVPDLSATGNNIRWYSDSELTTLVFSGNPFVTGLTDPGTYTYYATQTVSAQESTATEVTLTIYSLPAVIANATDELICAGEMITLTGSGALSYSWNQGVTDGEAFVPPSGVTTYTVTGTAVNGCTNTDFVDISVNEIPLIQVDADTVLCNDDDVVFSIMNINSTLFGDWKYNLSVDYGTSITGLNIGGEYEASDLSLNDHLVNHDTVYHSVSYHFIPRISPGDAGPDCENGKDTIIRIWVNPTPGIRVNTTDSVLCNGDPATIQISNPNLFVNSEWEYDLAVTVDPEITGASASATGINDAQLVDPLLNHDSIVHKVEYSFVPMKAADPDICAAGIDTTIVIWVNPTPEVRVAASDTILCSGDNVTIQLRNPNLPIRGAWEGTLEIIPESGITGVVAGIQPFTGDALYYNVLHNNANEQRSVTYIYTPQIRDENGDVCNNGRDTSIVVWVNPVAQVNTPPDLHVINTETTTPIIFSSNTQGGTSSYFWNNDTPSIGLASSGIGDIVPFAAINTGAAPVVATIWVSPAFSSFGETCPGPDIQFTITVNPSAPSADAGPDQTDCGSLATALEGNDPEFGTGTWSQVSGPGTISFGDATSYNTAATATTYGQYVLRWSIASGADTSSDELEIILNEDPVDASAGPDQEVCDILTTTLAGISHTYQSGSDHTGSTMEWTYVSGPDTAPVFSDITSPTSMVTVSQAGNYVFRLTETNGTCSRADDVSVGFNEPPVANAGSDQEVCFGETATLSASGGTQYSWDNGVENGVPFIPISTKEYQVTVTDANGCSSQDQVLVEVKPVPKTPTITFNTDTLFSDVEAGNQWYVDGVLIADATAAFLSPTSTGSYYSIVTEDGCSSEKSNNIFVQLTNIIQSELNKINIFPNPTEDFIRIETGNIGRYTLEITALTGQLILQEEVADPAYSLNLSEFTNGIYFVTIRVKDQLTIRKIIKQ